jgi:zinc/manganese transport system substrate-binding protein
MPELEIGKQLLMTADPNSRRLRIFAGLLLLSLVGCATEDDSIGNEVQVVATTSVIGDIAAGVIGDQGRVEVLIPIGVDAHDFQPSAQQAQLIAGADLVVANGLGLEEGLRDVLESATRDGAEIIELAPLVDPLPFSETGEIGEEEHPSEDPHFWMDPIRVGDAAEALAEVLSVSHPQGDWQQRAQDYAAEMAATDQTILGLVESIPLEARLLVTNHEAFGYFAARYDFEVIGVVIPGGSTLAEPSSAEIAALVETMEREGVQVIFAETSQPSVLAETIASELGSDAQVIALFTESLGPQGSGAETLSGLLLTNAERIATALG